jgi:Cu(I)/Ag(I) efflux system membrane protein CusA/SilA
VLWRYDLRVDDVTGAVEAAVGGEPVTVTVEGRQRYTVNVRYKEDFRSSPETLRQVLVALPTKSEGPRSLPLGERGRRARERTAPRCCATRRGCWWATSTSTWTRLADIGGFVDDAKRAVDAASERNEPHLSQGMYLKWTGQYELLEQMRERMQVLVPLALASCCCCSTSSSRT